jgi:hypothetical protein
MADYEAVWKQHKLGFDKQHEHVLDFIRGVRSLRGERGEDDINN